MKRYTRKFKEEDSYLSKNFNRLKEVETIIVSHELDKKLRLIAKEYSEEYTKKFGGSVDDAIARMCLSIVQANVKLDNKNAAKAIINLMKDII